QVRKGDGAWIPASRVARLFDKQLQETSATSHKPVPPPLPKKEVSVVVPTSLASKPSLSKTEVLDMAEDDGFRVEVLAYSSLGGAKDHHTAATIYFANQAGIRLKQVRITLRDSEAIAESGALHFMLGQIRMESKIGGVSGLGKAMMNKFVTKE